VEAGIPWGGAFGRDLLGPNAAQDGVVDDLVDNPANNLADNVVGNVVANNVPDNVPDNGWSVRVRGLPQSSMVMRSRRTCEVTSTD
jgi:hypothetical protein